MTDLKLVIFDCDGVMFDSKQANRKFYNSLLAQFSHPPMTDAELEYVHMHNVIDSVQYIFRNYPADLAEADIFRRSLDYVPFLKYMTMEPDLIDFLKFLQPQRQAAISTNRTTTMETILDIFKLRPYFEMVMTPMNLQNPKPHPEALARILAHYGREIGEAIYIGDSIIDQEHAANIGMRFIAFRNPELTADYHVGSFKEIETLPIY